MNRELFNDFVAAVRAEADEHETMALINRMKAGQTKDSLALSLGILALACVRDQEKLRLSEMVEKSWYGQLQYYDRLLLEKDKALSDYMGLCLDLLMKRTPPDTDPNELAKALVADLLALRQSIAAKEAS